MKLRFVLPPVLLLLSGGCASNQKVGGQYLPVELRTEPPAQRAYLVPSTRWSDGMMDNPSGAVSRYAVDAGGPVNRRVVDMP
ncbi:MAG TPA: hypothetical protein PKE47_03705, partial [Verrucomicrobiota bacterium]|nr:hypothetical protein [Verrucomicrobiota bacterium]